jgi:hypothetical protein
MFNRRNANLVRKEKGEGGRRGRGGRRGKGEEGEGRGGERRKILVGVMRLESNLMFNRRNANLVRKERGGEGRGRKEREGERRGRRVEGGRFGGSDALVSIFLC